MRSRFGRHCGPAGREVENYTACNLTRLAETWAVTPLADRGSCGPQRNERATLDWGFKVGACFG